MLLGEQIGKALFGKIALLSDRQRLNETTRVPDSVARTGRRPYPPIRSDGPEAGAFLLDKPNPKAAKRKPAPVRYPPTPAKGEVKRRNQQANAR